MVLISKAQVYGTC